MASGFNRRYYVRNTLLPYIQDSFNRYGQLELGELFFEMRAEHNISAAEAWEGLQALRLIAPTNRIEDSIYAEGAYDRGYTEGDSETS